jgi:hypothetical protein
LLVLHPPSTILYIISINPVSNFKKIVNLTYEGFIHELCQSNILGDSWQDTNIASYVDNFPLAKELFSAATLPLNKDVNSTVIYFLDRANHIIELGKPII